jgi:hypothetical protein
VAAAAAALRARDVVTHVEGVPIANDGTVPFREAERVNFAHLITLKFPGDPVALRVVRDSAELVVSTPAEVLPQLVPHSLLDRKPTYLVHAGLVFTALSQPFLHTEWGKAWDAKAPIRFVERALDGEVEERGQQVVVLTAVLAHPLCVGYDVAGLQHRQLLRVNGSPVRHMRDLRDLLLVTHRAAAHLEFELVDQKLVVLPTEPSFAATCDILTRHAIPHALSEDLRQADGVAVASADGGGGPTPAATAAGLAGAGAHAPGVAAAASPAAKRPRRASAVARDMR